MSQIYKSSSGGSIPPSVATEYDTDINSPAIPAANILDVVGGTTTANNTKGIRTDGSSGGNILTIQLTNRDVGSVQTTDATPTNVITLALGAVPGTYTFDVSVAAFASVGVGTPLGSGYTIVGAVRTTGAAAVLIPTQVVDHFEEGALAAANVLIGITGNNAVVTVTGVAAYTIDWVATLNYTFAS